MPPSNFNASIDADSGSLLTFQEKRIAKVTCMKDVEACEVSWLWRNRIPLGRITLIAGMPGQGKSFVTCDLAARVSCGRAFPDGSPCEAGSVLFIACEDDPADTIRPRLDAHHADPQKIHLLEGIELQSEDQTRELFFTLNDVEILEETIKSIPSLRLVIIDPIGSYIGTTANSNTDNEVRSVLAPIADIAKKYNVAVVMVAHTRKSQSRHADDMVMGSRAFTGIARAVWHLMPDSEDPKKRLLLAGKSNLSESNEGLSFRITGQPAAIDWNREPETRTANEVLAELFEGSKRMTAKDHAAKWLKSFLGDRQLVKDEILDAAKEQGHSEKAINAASIELGVIKKPVKYGGKYFWWIPVAPQTTDCRPVSENRGDSEVISGTLGENDSESSRVIQSDPTSETQGRSAGDSVVEGEL